jgi:hypothetical protein
MALHVHTKADRVYNFHQETLKALRDMVQAAGLSHPGAITAHHIVRRLDDSQVRLLVNLMPQVAAGALLKEELLADQHNVFKLYWPLAQANSFVALV